MPFRFNQWFLKGFLILAGVILALAAVAVLGINLYVQSAGTQKRIENALSSGLKVPVHVTSTIVTPWGGLKASGITVPQTSLATGNFLEAAGFTAHFDWMALTKHRLDASDLSLDDPQVTWFQSSDGRWELPNATPTPQPSPQPSPEAATEKPSRPPGPPWQITVHKLTVNGASFDFWDEKGSRVLEIAGVQFDCLLPNSVSTHGHASSRNVSLHDKLFFRDMQTDWSFERGALKLTSFQTAVGGGVLRGDAQVATRTKHTPFNADVNFDGVNVNQLMTDAGETDAQVTGTLNGWLDLYGNSGKRSTINGSGHLGLAFGHLRVDLLQILGQALQIPDLAELNLRTAEADVRIVSGVVKVDKVVFLSQNLQLTGHGTIGADGKLALDARLTINGTISSRLPSFILSYFKPADTGDSHYIDFAIGNTLAHPKTHLLDDISGHRIQGQATDLFQMIFGKKHKEAEPAATPP